jgi:hypothetical protein
MNDGLIVNGDLMVNMGRMVDTCIDDELWIASECGTYG